MSKSSVMQEKVDAFLKADLSDKPFLVREGHMIARFLFALVRDGTDTQFSLRAMSLVYTTLITIVPLLAVSFSVLKGFGVQNQLEPFLGQLLSGLGSAQAQEITEKIVDFVDNIKVGVLGAIGLAFLIYSVVSLMQKIEWSFNYIWRVGQGRSVAKRFSDYLTVLFIGPLAIFLSTSATTILRHSDFYLTLQDMAFVGSILSFFGLLVPWLVLAIGFAALYIFMPNTKVQIMPAFVGGLFAAFIWKVMGYVFSLFVTSSTTYVAIYAAFATLILFMVWIYIGWLVVLLGCNIAFYAQHPRFLRISRQPLLLSTRLMHNYGLSIVYYIGKSHHDRNLKWTTEGLAKSVNAPPIAVERILDALTEKGLVLATGDNEPTWHPAVSFATTPMQDVFDALESYGRAGKLSLAAPASPAPVAKLLDTMLEYRHETLGKLSIEKALGIGEHAEEK